MRALMCAVPLALVIAVTAAAQEPAPAPAPAPASTPAPAHASGPRLPANVRIDLSLSDQAGTQAPLRKTMSMILADGERGSVRSRPEIQLPVQVVPAMPKSYQTVKLPLNVDARPLVVGGKVRLRLTLEYSSIDRSQVDEPRSTSDVSFSGELVLESGRPAIVAEASDPTSDRKVTVEVKATVLK